MDWIADPNAWIALATLTALEIVLGVDNIIFISILVGRLPERQRDSARRLGLLLAMGTRIALLASLVWIMRLTEPLFELPVARQGVSGRDLILICGGLFLLWKSVHEIHGSLEGVEDGHHAGAATASFASVLIQIAIIDIVFSLDSVITAVGMARQLGVMIAAVILALVFMLFFAGRISGFIHRHPSLKVLALSFLMLIGCALVAESFHKEIPKGYIYFAMAFSVGVECLNIRMRAKQKPAPVALYRPYR
jgi:predicted tellurium resistance membrane protein TerC